LISGATIQDRFTGSIAHAIIDQIETLRNNEIDDKTLSNIHNLLGSFVYHCNTTFLRSGFQIELVEAPIETCQPDMKSWCLFCHISNMKKFITSAFDDLGRHSDPQRILASDRCIETLSVIIDYVNLVVFVNQNYGLVLREKKRLDDQSNLSSNKLLAISTHSVNGEDYHG
jgi:hypothetical protein